MPNVVRHLRSHDSISRGFGLPAVAFPSIHSFTQWFLSSCRVRPSPELPWGLQSRVSRHPPHHELLGGAAAGPCSGHGQCLRGRNTPSSLLPPQLLAPTSAPAKRRLPWWVPAPPRLFLESSRAAFPALLPGAAHGRAALWAALCPPWLPLHPPALWYLMQASCQCTYPCKARRKQTPNQGNPGACFMQLIARL